MEIEAVAYKPRNGGPARREIRCEELYDPLGYNVDVVVCGDFAFLSGTGPLDRAGNAVAFGDPVKQSHKTLENMQIMLEAAGMGFDDVAKVVYFLENVHDLKRVNVARKEFFGANRPVSTLVGGPALRGARDDPRRRSDCLQAAERRPTAPRDHGA